MFTFQRSRCLKTFKFLLVLFTFNFLLLTFPSPIYAQVNIGDKFGFGDFTSLGDATSTLVVPAFSIAAAGVVIYFLLGAFKYLRSGGNKEEVEGARKMISQAIIGFIILMFAFMVLQFIPQFFNLGGLDIFK